MIERVFFRFLYIYNIICEQYFIFDKKFQNFEEDYSNFLVYIFTILIFRPLYKIFKIIYISIKFLLKWFKYFIIIIPSNIFFFIITIFKLTDLTVEFIFMFVSNYLEYIKRPLLKINYRFMYKYTGPKLEFKDENYKRPINTVPAPDLKIYYPMRFALNSVVVRITGFILSISLLLIFIFSFINFFLLGNLNIGDMFYSGFVIKFLTIFADDIQENPITHDLSKHNNYTFFSNLYCLLYVMGNFLFICLKYFYYDTMFRFQLSFLLDIRHLISLFFYLFTSKMFITILPIHFYYVLYHCYTLLPVSKAIEYIILYFLILLKGFFIALIRLLKGIINFFRYIFDPEEKVPNPIYEWWISKEK